MKARIKSKIENRNEIFQQTRDFFYQRNVLEVDTPLVRQYTVTDPYMSALGVFDSRENQQGYLQTSPEYAMKELLSDGSGDIFQLSKMFRADEQSKIHSSEFTMLEWYRIGFDHIELIEEVVEFIQQIVGTKKTKIVSYRDVFLSVLSIDPFNISFESLKKKSTQLLGELPEELLFDNYLTLLFSEKIELSFDQNLITIVKDYPASQASLAKARSENGITTADRFEVYLAGMELANGFNELTDPQLQLVRFKEDNQIRKQLGYPEIEIDTGFINALEKGLPNCAGVALGIDRLLMIKLGEKNISEVIL